MTDAAETVDPLAQLRLDGKVALVTGASSGIGARIARVLDALGATVVVAARRTNRIEELAASLARGDAATCDVSVPGASATLVGEAVERHGRIDVVVANAGISNVVPALREQTDRFAEVVTVDLVAPFELARAAAAHMRERGEGGTIVNVASAAAFSSTSVLPQASYVAAKTGLVGLTRELALQLGQVRDPGQRAVPGHVPERDDGRARRVRRAAVRLRVGGAAAAHCPRRRARRGDRVPLHERQQLHDRPGRRHRRGWRPLIVTSGPTDRPTDPSGSVPPNRQRSSVKAAVYHRTGAPDVLQYEDVPDPTTRAGGVLVEVEAISIEGGDTLNRLGGAMAATPHIVGYQCAGTIREVGPDVTDRAVGQRVVATMAHGSHAELVAVPAGSTWLVPDGMDLAAAACVPIAFGTADDCLFEFGRLRAGETVLIQAGGGGVGIAAIQLAKRAGATVLATASTADKLERLAPLGLDHGINYVADDLAEVARRLTGGKGVDLVLDSVGSTLPGSIRALAYRGRISYVGNAGRDITPVDVSALMGGNQSIQGVFLGAELALGDRAHANIARLLDEVASGALQVVIDSTFPLAEAAAAHARMEDRQAFGRVVLVP